MGRHLNRSACARFSAGGKSLAPTVEEEYALVGPCLDMTRLGLASLCRQLAYILDLFGGALPRAKLVLRKELLSSREAHARMAWGPTQRSRKPQHHGRDESYIQNTFKPAPSILFRRLMVSQQFDAALQVRLACGIYRFWGSQRASDVEPLQLF